MRSIICAFFSLNLLLSGATEPEKAEKPAESSEKDSSSSKPVEPTTRESSITIDGKKVSYKATTGKLQLKQDDGKTRASIFHVSYERTDVKDPSTRPVMEMPLRFPPASSLLISEKAKVCSPT